MTMNHTYIQNFSNFNTVEGCYIISNIRFGMTRSGKPYLNATLSDASGSIGMVCWEVDGSVTPALNDQIVEVCGSVGTYREAPQLCAEQLAPADLRSLDADDMAALVPRAPIDVDACAQYIASLVESFSDPRIYDICNYLLWKHWDLFSVIPAGKSVHHAFLHGLMMHSADMAVVAETIAAQNRSSVNRDLLLAGVLLHDIGKLEEFVTSPVTGLVTGYTDRGNLVGHSVLGALEIAEAADTVGAGEEVTLMLQHMLLSHHGDPAAGAAKQPMTIEAEILHDLDKLDSRKQIFAEQLNSRPPHSYTATVPSLGRKLYRHGVTETGELARQEAAWEAEEDDGWDTGFEPDEDSDSDPCPCPVPGDEAFPFVSRVVATFPSGYQMSGDFDGEIFYPDDPDFPVL